MRSPIRHAFLLLAFALSVSCNHAMRLPADPGDSADPADPADLAELVESPNSPNSANSFGSLGSADSAPRVRAKGGREAWIQELCVQDDPALGRPIQVGVKGWGLAPPQERFLGTAIQVNEQKKTVRIRMLLASAARQARGDVHMIFPATASFTLSVPGRYTLIPTKGDATLSIEVKAKPSRRYPSVSTLPRLPNRSAPCGVACDRFGNIYVTDSYYHAVWRGGNGGPFVLFAGGKVGYRDGCGREARFSFPSGVVVDSSGTVFVADTGNHRIRKIRSDGTVTTLAGSGKADWFEGDYADGPGKTARFNHPAGLVLDQDGSLLVADLDNYRIRRVSPDGAVTTFAEDGFWSPECLAMDGNRQLFVLDGEERIQKIDRSGEVSTLRIRGRGERKFKGLAIDPSGNLFVSDGQRIRRIESDGTVHAVAGFFYFFQDGEGPIACFRDPNGLALDPEGHLLIADAGNGRIRQIDWPRE